MELVGYKPQAVQPFHAASGSFAVVTTSKTTAGTATAIVPFKSGMYDVAVNYFDLIGGQSTWKLEINNRTVGRWRGDLEAKLGHAPSIYLDGHSATRITFRGVNVSQGAVVRITGQGQGIEPAPLDYISFLPPGIVD
jgi:alpha-glucuronidase